VAFRAWSTNNPQKGSFSFRGVNSVSFQESSPAHIFETGFKSNSIHNNTRHVLLILIPEFFKNRHFPVKPQNSNWVLFLFFGSRAGTSSNVQTLDFFDSFLLRGKYLLNAWFIFETGRRVKNFFWKIRKE